MACVKLVGGLSQLPSGKMSVLQNHHHSSHRLGPLLELFTEKSVARLGLGTELPSAPQVICVGQQEA